MTAPPSRSKAWFVVVAPVLLCAGAVHAGSELAQPGASLAWLAALGALVTLPVQLGVFYVRPPTKSHRAMPVASGAAAACAVLAAVVPGGGAIVVGYAVAGLLAVLAYTHWSTRLERAAAPLLKAGSVLPSFPVSDESGAPVDVARYRGRRALFLFYRGNWCPLCMAQIKEVARQYRELEARGVKVVLVSPQPDRATRELAGKLDVPFDFLVDRGAAAARLLGIAHDGGVPAGFGVLGYEADTVLPTAVLVDEEGRILLSHQTDNYRVRPEPETFLRLLDDARTPGGP